MKLKHAQAIVEHINANLSSFDDEARVDETYSGRGMFGETTAAVLADDTSTVFKAMGALGIEDSERTDSMGLGVVVY